MESGVEMFLYGGYISAQELGMPMDGVISSSKKPA
jgi:hypothetical protein